MFTWICPKCGKEVPPSYSECPNCSGREPAAAPQAEAPKPASAPAPPPMRPPAAAAPRAGMPPWLMSILFALGFAALLGGGYWLYHSLQSPAQPAPAATAAPMTAPVAASPAVQASPVLRNLEVTGLRLIEDAKQKAFLQFVVVNHSAADLGDVAAKANLRSAASAPIATFAFKTTLGPYEAKDLKVAVQTKLRVYELPDWQFLRAELVP